MHNLLLKINLFEERKNKKCYYHSISLMVAQAGIEPATHGFSVLAVGKNPQKKQISAFFYLA